MKQKRRFLWHLKELLVVVVGVLVAVGQGLKGIIMSAVAVFDYKKTVRILEVIEAIEKGSSLFFSNQKQKQDGKKSVQLDQTVETKEKRVRSDT